jgi:Ser/Thr protein kinase RdoA (MazF antagonist)
LRTETWRKSCLVEYYTVAFKYENDGSYALDIWRAGMGQHPIARSDAHLWNLGDYLSRLRSCAGRFPFLNPGHELS